MALLLSAPPSLKQRTIKLSQISQRSFAQIAPAATLRLGHMRVEAVPATEQELHEDCSAENPLATSTTFSSSSSLSSSLISERGVTFSTGPSFFRAQSSLGRDLAVLAAALYKRSQGRLRVLDAMAGCGVRALRYLKQSDADFVLVNDCNPNLHSTIVENFSRYMPLQGNGSNTSGYSRKDIFDGANGMIQGVGQPSVDDVSSECHGSNALEISSGRKEGFELGSNSLQPSTSVGTSLPLQNSVNFYSYGVSRHAEHETEMDESSINIRWQVCHEEAARLLSKCNLNLDFYDFIDIDSFGSDSFFLGPALSALRFGGLLFVTSTDGFSSGGHRPYNSLAQYGTFMRPMPYANELGLRMLMGAVVKEAAVRNMSVTPIFSVYAPHGPVFRVLLRATAGKPQKIMHYGFIYYCNKCGDSRIVEWEKLGSTCCPCSDKVSDSLKMSGPLWTGPLHNTEDIQDMIGLANEWGWISDLNDQESAIHLSGGRRKKKQEKLWELLNIMMEESHPKLPFGFISLDEIAKRGKVQSPRRETFIKALRNEGYIASRSHVCSNAVKTNCSMTSCLALARRLAGTEDWGYLRGGALQEGGFLGACLHHHMRIVLALVVDQQGRRTKCNFSAGAKCVERMDDFGYHGCFSNDTWKIQRESLVLVTGDMWSFEHLWN
ncbi:hypothetical protein GOP47_0008325 [Adiantum capillus-veneris]|uniref:tRNA (guanine(26)-N(2))-dimethyltransferase n=1 Tax=Adiantum capillus-veneris TaxID=13818 RepID=A0A9D4UY24_ADICA|nr:hypothetical protein GOP47_0008325 [Adiantum capillus-veneris]